MTGRHRAPRKRSFRKGAAILAVAAVGASLVALAPQAGAAGQSVTASAAATGSATGQVVAKRTNFVNGVNVAVDTRDVHVTVDQVASLRNRQAITVSWTGAHPTGGTVADTTSAAAAQQEYPVMIMECRGVDSALVAPNKQVAPRTCWTQTPEERWRGDATFLYPPFRLDREASVADRAQSVGVPNPLPNDCSGADAGAEHWVPFVGADNVSYVGGPIGCAGIAPDEVKVASSLQPGNTTYAVTGVDGSGSSKFIINTAESNASLGCSSSVPCSLVVVPIMGISCDAAGALLPAGQQTPADQLKQAQSQCIKTGHYAPGSQTDGGADTEDLAVSGQLWWSASNWKNRVSFPLSFSPPANVCDLVSTQRPVYVYGSEAMQQATLQWAPSFCLNPKLFKFQQVEFSEPGSRNLLESGSIEAGLVGGPPQQAYSKPVVQAPVALTGFTVAFALDDVQGRPVVNLKLTPRLLAKLLTMSYPSAVGVRREYTALKSNPLDMVADPEFRALNPGSMSYIDGYDSIPASTLYAISSDSDVMRALTSYINADAQARAWLDGMPDPWGMVVNPNYKGIKLPLDSWPVLDNFAPTLITAGNPCFATGKVPWLPLVAAPVSNPAAVTFNMQFNIANSQVVCQNAGLKNQKLTSLGRQVPGRRAMFGVVALGDAARYQLPTAQLLTSVAPTAPAKFVDTTGLTFVGPNDASLRAAAALLVPSKAVGTWPIPYAAMHTGAGASAYPGTMLMSLNVPTQGLPAADAARYASLVRFAAGAGQTPGIGNGQLPQGYLPMTEANGMGSLANYSLVAADAIQAQQGSMPAVDGSVVPPSPTPQPSGTSTSPRSSGGGGPSQGPTPGASSQPGQNTSPTGKGSPLARPVVSPSASSSTIAMVATGITVGADVGPLGKTLPVLLVFALLAALGAAFAGLWGRL